MIKSKIIIPSLIILSIILSVLNYSLKSEKNKLKKEQKELLVDNMLINELIDESFSHIGQKVSSDIVLTDSLGNQLNFKELLIDSINVFFIFSEGTCPSCIKDQIELFESLNMDLHNRIISLCHFSNYRKLSVFIKSRNIPFNFYCLNSNVFNIDKSSESIILIVDSYGRIVNFLQSSYKKEIIMKYLKNVQKK